ncbi:MAG TPA: hypothetical protein PLN33_13150, partial [Hyphomonadaceae bacterium]|nr:hypothetical protein [Hyphomonadaceae bacterium]
AATHHHHIVTLLVHQDGSFRRDRLSHVLSRHPPLRASRGNAAGAAQLGSIFRISAHFLIL